MGGVRKFYDYRFYVAAAFKYVYQFIVLFILSLLGLSLAILSVIAIAYYGIWVFIIGGIADIINLFNLSYVESKDVAFAFGRCALGFATFGVVLAFWDCVDTYKNNIKAPSSFRAIYTRLKAGKKYQP